MYGYKKKIKNHYTKTQPIITQDNWYAMLLIKSMVKEAIQHVIFGLK